MEQKSSNKHLNQIKDGLKKINSIKVHFLGLPKPVRDILEISLKQYDIETLAHDLSLEIDVLNKWVDQLHHVERIISQYNLSGRKKGRRWQHLPVAARQEILLLKEEVSVSTLSQVFQVTESAIYYWKEKGSSKKTSPHASVVILNDKETSILASEEGIALNALIIRHRGKVRRKYSSSEKRLILALVDRFGSKAVYDVFKVSYDTIARLQRKSKMEANYVPHVPLRYAPVVEIMDKYPGMGPMQIRDYIHRHLGKSMGVNSVRKVMEDNGWVPPYAKKIRVSEDVPSRVFFPLKSHGILL